MKTLLHKTFLAATLAMFSLLANAHDFEVDSIYYSITSSTDLTVEVTYEGDSYYAYSGEYSGDVSIPETVSYDGNTYAVTSIDDNTFRACYGLTSVNIPDGVKSIGGNTFCGCSGLTSVTIPNSVTSISDEAFAYCI